MRLKEQGKIDLQCFPPNGKHMCSMCIELTDVGLAYHARGTENEIILCMNCELNLKWRNDTWPRIRCILSRLVPHRGIVALINSFCYVSFHDVYRNEAAYFQRWAMDRYIWAAKAKAWKRAKAEEEDGGNIQSH